MKRKYDLVKFMDKIGETLFYDELYCLLRDYLLYWLERRAEDKTLKPPQRAFCTRLLNLLTDEKADINFDIKIWIVEKGD